MRIAPPDIFAYLDYREYLSAWFEWRKSENPRFSHRLFARMAEQRSPSLLLQVIQRKRNLSDATAGAFARAMKLDAEQTACFSLLVAFDQAPTEDERNEAWKALHAERRFREARRIEGDGFTYLSHAWIPAIRELAACPGFKEDPAWIASKLKPPITEAQATEALALLMDLRMLVRGEDGRLHPVDVSVATRKEVGTLAVHNYHREMAERSRQNLAEVPPEERHYLGLTVAIPPSLVPVLKEQLNALQTRLLELCDGTPDLKRRVVQINLHMFPLSEDVG